MWEFHAAGAPKPAWSWTCYGGKPFTQRRSAAVFPSYQDVIADATRQGFNIVTDRWRIITPSDGIPLYDRPRSKPGQLSPAALAAEARQAEEARAERAKLIEKVRASQKRGVGPPELRPAERSRFVHTHT